MDIFGQFRVSFTSEKMMDVIGFLLTTSAARKNFISDLLVSFFPIRNRLLAHFSHAVTRYCLLLTLPNNWRISVFC